MELLANLGEGAPAEGAVLFAAECARCHSPRVVDRGSRLFRSYPRLDCTSYLDTVSNSYLATVIWGGGEALGMDPLMRPFQEVLSREEVADLVAYLRSSPGAE